MVRYAFVTLTLLLASVGCGGKSPVEQASDDLDAAVLESALACDQLWITTAVLGEDQGGTLAADCGIRGADALSQEAATEHLIALLRENEEMLGPERVHNEIAEATDALLGWCDLCVERLDRYAAALE